MKVLSRLRSEGNAAARHAIPGRASVYEAEDGFTLIELIIVLLVIPMLIFGVTAAIIASLQNQNTEYNRLSDTADASIASAYFARDVQSASAVTTSGSPQCGTNPTWRPLVSLLWQQQISSRTVSDATIAINTPSTITSATAIFQVNPPNSDSGSTVSDPKVDGGDGILNNETITPISTTVANLSSSLGLSNVSGDRVTISRVFTWRVTYWDEPIVSAATGATTYDLVRELCQIAAAVPPPTITVLAHDLPSNQVFASVGCGPGITSNCSSSYLATSWLGCQFTAAMCPLGSLNTAGVESISLSAVEPASDYQFDLSASPRYSNPTIQQSELGGNPVPTLLLSGDGPGTLNVTNPNVSLNITGNLVFNCIGSVPNGCTGPLVDLDASNATVADTSTNPGQNFQVANCPSSCAATAIVNTHSSLGVYTGPGPSTATTVANPWVPVLTTATVGGCSSSTFICTPGVYASSPTFVGGNTYTFQPGNYLFQNGFTIPNNRVFITGTGVFFYVSGGQVSIADVAAVNHGNQMKTAFYLTPPTTGPYAGVSLYQAPTDSNSLILWAPGTGASATAPYSISGAVEAPGAPVLIGANSKAITLGYLVAKSLSVSSVEAASCSSTCTVNISG
jgi:hypothetical protein